MKARVSSLFLLSSALTCLPLAAAPLYWDANGGGVWGLNTNWSTSATGGAGTDPLAAPTTGDTAHFNITGQNVAAQSVTLSGGTVAVDGINVTNIGTLSLLGGTGPSTLQIGTGGITASQGTGVADPAVVNNNLTIGSGTVANDAVAIQLMGTQTWAYNGGYISSGSSGITIRNGVSLGVAGAQTLTLAGTTGPNPNNTISGAISNGAGVLSLTLSGTSSTRWNLGGNNTYTGVTTINTGGLGITNGNALGATGASSGTVVASGASLFLRAGVTVGETIQIAGRGSSNLGALRTVANSGTSNWNGPITAVTTSQTTIGTDEATTFNFSSTADITTTGSSTLEFTANGPGIATTNVNGDISGPASVSKTGTATHTLNFGGDEKTYTGATTVTTGTLSLNTTLSGTSGVTVGANGTLQGNAGIIRTAAPVVVNGILAPGVAATPISNITMGNLTMNTGSTLRIDLNSSTATIDRLNVADLSLLGTVALNLTELGSGPLAIGDALLFIKTTGVWNNGLLTVDGVAISDESQTFTRGDNTFMIDYNRTVGADTGVALVVVVVVPEPAAAGLAVLSAGLLGFRRRRKSRDWP